MTGVSGQPVLPRHRPGPPGDDHRRGQRGDGGGGLRRLVRGRGNILIKTIMEDVISFLDFSQNIQLWLEGCLITSGLQELDMDTGWDEDWDTEETTLRPGIQGGNSLEQY